MKPYIRLLGILLFLLILVNIDVGEVWEACTKANWYFLSIVVLLNLFIVLLRSLRWQNLIEIQGYKFSFLPSFFAYLRSLYLGNVTPARIGELSRAHYLMKYVKVDSAIAFSSVVFDRVLDMYSMLILGMIALLSSTIWVGEAWMKVVFILAIFLFPLFVFYPKMTYSFLSLLPNFKGIRTKAVKWAQGFFEGMAYFLSKKVWFSVLLTLIVYSFFFLQCFLLAYAMDLNIDFFYLTFCVVVFSSFSILPISVSNVGTREFVLIVMFSAIGLSSELAVSYSLLFFVVINLTLVLWGWLTYIFYNDKVFHIENNTCNM